MAKQKQKSINDMGAQVKRIIDLGYRDGNVYQENPRVSKAIKTFSRYAQNIFDAQGGVGKPKDINRKFSRRVYMGFSKG